MPHLLSPSWLKKADRFSKGVKKFIAYQRDLIPEAKLAEVGRLKDAYDAALKAKDREALEGKEANGEAKAVDGLEKRLLRICERGIFINWQGCKNARIECVPGVFISDSQLDALLLANLRHQTSHSQDQADQLRIVYFFPSQR